MSAAAALTADLRQVDVIAARSERHPGGQIAYRKLNAVDMERKDRTYRLKQAELFMETLKRIPEDAKLENTELFMALVDQVIVGNGLTFIMRDGTKHKVNGAR